MIIAYLRISILVLLSSLAWGRAVAEEIPFAGVWAGTIGNHPVVACFTAGDAQYYYVKHLSGIRLVENEDHPDYPTFLTWQEQTALNDTGKWTLAKPEGTRLQGQWRDLDGRTVLPIELTKKAELTDDKQYGRCGPAYFDAIADGALEKTRNWTIYTMPGKYAGAARFNATMRDWRRQQTVDAYFCKMETGQDRELEFVADLLTDSVIVLRETLFEGNCGAMHNESYSTKWVFDVHSGEKVDTRTWIDDEPGGAKRARPPVPLKKLIDKKVRAAEDNADCRNLYSIGAPYPLKTGMQFPITHIWALRTCDTAVEIPYGQLAPYLTPVGKRAVGRLLSH